MYCPYCSSKTTVLDDVLYEKENELYRKRRCPSCGFIFHTCEMTIEETEEFKNIWKESHR